jgi:hypothetical protein
MKEREGIIVSGVLTVLLLGWLGFLVHRSPRFPGSGVGAIFGIAGAVLMLVPLAYPIAKRIPFLHARITAHVSMQSLLALHVYAGIFGPLLAIIHTGHKFDSGLGITLTAVMLLVVVSGFAVRYLLTYDTHEIKDKLVLLQTARGDLDNAEHERRRAVDHVFVALGGSRKATAVPHADVHKRGCFICHYAHSLFAQTLRYPVFWPPRSAMYRANLGSCL